jgi:hypothetical protein
MRPVFRTSVLAIAAALTFATIDAVFGAHVNGGLRWALGLED